MRPTFTSLLHVLLLISLVATTTLAVIAVPNLGQSTSFNQDIKDVEILNIELNDSVPFNIANFDNETYQCLVDRTIETSEQGAVVESTKINITNNGPAMFNSFNFIVPTTENRNMHYFSLRDLSNRTQPEYTLISSDENDTIYQIHLPDIEINDSYQFKMSAAYSDVMFVKGFRVGFNKTFLPLLSIPITKLDIFCDAPVTLTNETALTPDDEAFHGNMDDGNARFHNITHLPIDKLNISALPELFGYNESVANTSFIPGYRKELRNNMTYYLSFDFSAASALIEYQSVIRTIKINQWDRVIYEEEITFLNQGPLPVRSLDIRLSSNVTFKGASDIYGNLTTRVTAGPTRMLVTVNTRLQFEINKTYTVKIKYQESLKTGLEKKGGKITLKPWLMSIFNLTVREYQMDLILPYGSTYKGSANFTETPTISYGTEKGFLGIEFLGQKMFYYPKVTYKLFNQTQLDNSAGIVISYNLDPIWFLYDPLAMMVAFLLIGVMYVMVRLVMTTSWGLAAPVIEEIPYEEIERFVRAYEEKTSLQERLKRLTRDYKRRKLQATKYEKSKTLLDHKITEAERDLVQVAGTLRKSGRRYDTGVRNIEIAELEREDVLENIKRLEKRRSDGAIGKDAYNRLKRDYNRQLQRANNKIDKALIELRAALTEGR